MRINNTFNNGNNNHAINEFILFHITSFSRWVTSLIDYKTRLHEEKCCKGYFIDCKNNC